MTYEYKIYSDSYSDKSESELNKLGADGWQLMTNWQLGSLVFMRGIPDESEKKVFNLPPGATMVELPKEAEETVKEKPIAAPFSPITIEQQKARRGYNKKP
jgi:hypothetical protein